MNIFYYVNKHQMDLTNPVDAARIAIDNLLRQIDSHYATAGADMFEETPRRELMIAVSGCLWNLDRIVSVYQDNGSVMPYLEPLGHLCDVITNKKTFFENSDLVRELATHDSLFKEIDGLLSEALAYLDNPI